jgi:hypothetical protein
MADCSAQAQRVEQLQKQYNVVRQELEAAIAALIGCINKKPIPEPK